jgi:hypothetical protein
MEGDVSARKAASLCGSPSTEIHWSQRRIAHKEKIKTNIYAGGPRTVPSSLSEYPVRGSVAEAPPCDPVCTLQS